MMSAVHIVYASDDANARAVAVSAKSLLASSPSATVTVLASGWGPDAKAFLSQSDSAGRLIRMDVDGAGLPPGKDHISSAAFLRLLIPKLLAGQSRCLYLDADTLVRDDLAEVFDLLGGDIALAGVRDPVTPRIGCSAGILASSGSLDGRHCVNLHGDYVNSGVLAMNLDRWRDESIGDRALEWIRRNPQAWGDQDAINAVVNGRVGLLPNRFNATVHMMRPNSTVLAFADRAEVEEARSDPAVVHFTGAVKPWHSNASMPFLEEWRAVAAELGWTRFRHSFTVRRRVERRLIHWIDSQA